MGKNQYTNIIFHGQEGRVYRLDHLGAYQQTFFIKADSEHEARIKLRQYCMNDIFKSEPIEESGVHANPFAFLPGSFDLKMNSAKLGTLGEKKLIAKRLEVLNLKIETKFYEGVIYD